MRVKITSFSECEVARVDRAMSMYPTRSSMGGIFGSNASTCERFNVRQSDVAFHLMMTDITKLPVDCIVNAATNNLLGGGGVDGAIHRAAGAGLMRSCYMEPTTGHYSYSRCETGDAVLTKGPFSKNLLATDIIHTVGPIVTRSSVQEGIDKLENCIKKCLLFAHDNNYRSIAFPAVSCGIYNSVGDNWTDLAAQINIGVCLSKLHLLPSLKHIIFALPDADIYQIFRRVLIKKLYNIPEEVSPPPRTERQQKQQSKQQPKPQQQQKQQQKEQSKKQKEADKEQVDKKSTKSGEKRPAPPTSPPTTAAPTEAEKSDETAAIITTTTAAAAAPMVIEAAVNEEKSPAEWKTGEDPLKWARSNAPLDRSYADVACGRQGCGSAAPVASGSTDTGDSAAPGATTQVVKKDNEEEEADVRLYGKRGHKKRDEHNEADVIYMLD